MAEYTSFPILRGLASYRSFRLCIAVATVTALCCVPSSLFGVHGVEAALILSVAVCPFVLASAISISSSYFHASLGTYLRGLLPAALVFVIVTGILLLNQIRVRQCEPLNGFLFMLLGPGFAYLLAACIGLFLGKIVRSKKVALWIGAAVSAGSLVFGLYEFWATPTIAVYSHLNGWFPGTFYDVDVRIDFAYLSFRATTLLWCVALSAAYFSRSGLRLRLGAVATAIATGALATLLLFLGTELGHRSSVDHIEEVLGKVVEGDKCIVTLPRETHPDEVDRLVADCDYRVYRAEQKLSVKQTEKVHAFFYRSIDEKRALMGAGRTFIAKPWRGEVHLQQRPWPHAVLAHEVVHAVAANAARGPFRISGTWGGWLPNPGLIEGTAVAIAQDIRDDLGPHQWSRAMLEMERLPPLESLMSLDFVRLSPRLAYAAAGSFIMYFVETYGEKALQDAYRHGRFKQPLNKLEKEWRAFLLTPASNYDPKYKALAEHRFSSGSIFATTCPHKIAKLKNAMGLDWAAGDLGAVRKVCREILDIEPGDLGARVTSAIAAARKGDQKSAAQELKTLEDAPAPVLAQAREAIADAAYLRGEYAVALKEYLALQQLPQVRSQQRMLYVKAVALRSPPHERDLLMRLLVGDKGRPLSSAQAVHTLSELSRSRKDGLAEYLAARQLAAVPDYEQMLMLLKRTPLVGHIPLQRENDLMRVRANVALRRFAEASKIIESAEPSIEISDWKKRITFLKSKNK